MYHTTADDRARARRAAIVAQSDRRITARERREMRRAQRRDGSRELWRMLATGVQS
jgi:hypothetical protein